MSFENDIITGLKERSSPEYAARVSGFFKTGKGGYGEGDVFIGIKVPDIRKVAKEYETAPLESVLPILRSRIHEHRLCALIIFTYKFKKAPEKEKKKIYDLYLDNIKFVNNWDLVDLSAPNIIGNYLLNNNRKILYKLAKSPNLWERRISIISTLEFIKHNEYNDTLKISNILLNDNHDLIHKAVGWMLREVGKRDMDIETGFLDLNYKEMPRTMLRYAIERFPEKLRKYYMKK